MFVVPLDLVGIHAVELHSAPGGALRLALVHRAGDRRSATHEALLRQLRIRQQDLLASFDPETASVLVARESFVLSVHPFDLLLSRVVVTPEGACRLDDAGAPYLLSAFELRYAADAGALHPVPTEARAPLSWTPRTDLHSHFAGCVSGADLVELAAHHGISYPRALLGDARVHTDAESVRVGELSPLLRARLAERLEVPLDRRVTFLEMERIYRLRAPITKAPAAFVPLCRRIATDYRAAGVEYVELSLGSIVEARVLAAVHAELPAIEAETGVTLRFLAAISRHDDPEWDLDLFDRIKTLAGSVYLSGIDVMGHETNSTRVFLPLLKAFATWADRARPGFVLRVHAGESPAHPENVRLALEAAEGHTVQLRIGHGLFGVDGETLAKAVAAEAVVEFNLDSNVALNHLQSARNVPIRRYVEAGARVVLGSDGYGIYRTSPRSTARAALLAGLHPGHLRGPLAKVEHDWIERSRARDVTLLRQATTFVVPADVAPTFFTPAVVARRVALREARDRALDLRLQELGTPLVTDVAAMLRDRGPRPLLLSVAGAWTHTWSALTDAEREHARAELGAFVAGLDPAEAVLITGGTREGVEGIVGRAARARGVPVLAALVRETPPEALDGEAMTHAVFVGESLYDKGAGLYELVAAHAGACLFVSGGQIVSDEIQTAHNLRLRFLLMDGAGGASARHAKEHPARAFRHGAEALHALREWRELPPETVPHWYEGMNPTVDAVVLRATAAGPEVLLILRDLDAPAEAGRWALPGGFVASRSARGGRWSAAETDEAACVRELAEETGLVATASRLVRLGVFEGGHRDPRDTARSWSRSTAFAFELAVDASSPPLVLAGGDDAADVRFWPVDGLPPLAFDHARIVATARSVLGL